MSVLFLSHRGESDDAPENTLRAFALAISRESDGIELDVRLTADKQVVCCHDEDLQRVAGVPGKVAEADLADLRRHHPVPLLAELLDILPENMHLQVELKGDPAVVPYCREVIAGSSRVFNLAISSFERETIAAAAGAFPGLPRLLLTDLEAEFGRFPTAAQVVEMLAPLKCGVSFKASFAVDADFVNELRAAGLRVVGWGVFNDELGLHLARTGVDAMTCNHAVALREKYRKICAQ